jgi:hypothetical protein
MTAADEERNDVVPGSAAVGDLDMSTVLHSTVLRCRCNVLQAYDRKLIAVQHQRWAAICRGI